MCDAAPATGTVLVPVGKDQPLPEPAMLVLRGLWARLGYQGRAFVEMQVEVSKELARADFARFEREMLCNEIISLRQELDLIRDDRNEHMRRAEAVQVNLSQVMDAEERTFKALVAERELAKRAIERAERGVAQVSAAREKEAVRAEAMGEEVRRLEKERVAAVLYARTAEEQAVLANMTAKTAAAVAMSAVHTQPSTPRVGFAPAPAPPSRPTTPGRHAPATPRATPRLAPAPSPAPSRASGLHNWEDIDSAIMQTKMRERRIEAEENRLAAEATRLAQDRIRLRVEKERIGSPVGGSGSISGSSHHHHHHHSGWSHQGGH